MNVEDAFNTLIIQRADRFATKAHGDQKRKYTNEPYMVHPRAVAKTLQDLGYRTEVIAAALMHDVIEDTPVTFLDIVDAFGVEVADLVMEVTDQSRKEDGNREVRKEIDRQHLANASRNGQAIKLADLIDNTSSIVEHDPDFAKIYLNEKSKLLEVLTKGNHILQKRAEVVLLAGIEKIYGTTLFNSN